MDKSTRKHDTVVIDVIYCIYRSATESLAIDGAGLID